MLYIFETMLGRIVIAMLVILCTRGVQAQPSKLEPKELCDSVLSAVRKADAGLLKDLLPSYNDLKGLYDSAQIEMMAYQIAGRQKDLDFNASLALKRLKKYAAKNNIRLSDLQVLDKECKVLADAEGRRFSRALLKVAAGKKKCDLSFVLIELNEQWFYGEGLKLVLTEELAEEVPDYDAIDRAYEKKQAEREKTKQAAEEAKLKAVQDSIKAEEKKLAEALKLRDKELKDSLAAVKLEQKAAELAEKEKTKAAKDSLALQKEQERLAIKKEKEAAAKLKAQEKKAKEKEKKQLAKEKAKAKKAKEKDKKRQADEKKKQQELDKKQKPNTDRKGDLPQAP